MNTGQMLITIGAIALLSVIILRVNGNSLGTSDVMFDSKFGVLAVSLGESIIEEASGKSFDAATSANSISDLSLLTAPGSLGPAYGEHYPYFNDFDDFNGLTLIDSTLPSAKFLIKAKVFYISPSDVNVKSSSRTWHKKIEVQVASPSMRDTVKLSSVYSYFYFR